jgi:hypothetical protein
VTWNELHPKPVSVRAHTNSELAKTGALLSLPARNVFCSFHLVAIGRPQKLRLSCDGGTALQITEFVSGILCTKPFTTIGAFINFITALKRSSTRSALMI